MVRLIWMKFDKIYIFDNFLQSIWYVCDTVCVSELNRVHSLARSLANVLDYIQEQKKHSVRAQAHRFVISRHFSRSNTGIPADFLCVFVVSGMRENSVRINQSTISI